MDIPNRLINDISTIDKRSNFKCRNFLLSSLPIYLKPRICYRPFLLFLQQYVYHVTANTCSNRKHWKTNYWLCRNLENKLSPMVLCQFLFMSFHCWLGNGYYWRISKLLNRSEFHKISRVFNFNSSWHWQIDHKIFT